TDGEQFHGAAIDQLDCLEIDGERSAFLINRDTKDVHSIPQNPPADAQDHNRPNPEPVDSARHGNALPGAWLVRNSPRSVSCPSRVLSANRPPFGGRCNQSRNVDTFLRDGGECRKCRECRECREWRSPGSWEGGISGT